MTAIAFYKEYYRAIAYSNKGLELKKTAEDAGAGIGIAVGCLKYAMTILS